MAFIEPMHRNKPNITYLLTVFVKPWCIPVKVTLDLSGSPIEIQRGYRKYPG